MHIQCTKALLDYLKPQVTEKDTDSDMYAWHAHIVKRSRRNCFVLIHDLSRFVLVFYPIKKSDMRELYQMVSVAMANAMLGVGFTPEEVEAYIKSQPTELTFKKNQK